MSPSTTEARASPKSSTYSDQPDYDELRAILERQFERPVSLEEATGTGNFLINVYEILLSDEQTGATIRTDTT
jgi:hypothetical protein